MQPIADQVLRGSGGTEIALLYVARGGPGGLAAVAEFVESLRKSPSGVTCDLFFLAKNWLTSEHAYLHQLAREASAEICWLPDDSFDWGAYFRTAPRLQHRWLCLLNSHSRPQVKGWLQKLREAVSSPGIGIAGATGSWESARSGFMIGRHGFVHQLRGIAYRALSVAHRRKFRPFPNPHIRTTGLIIARQLFVDFAALSPLPKNRNISLSLESGCNGLSAFVTARKLNMVVVGADGSVFHPEDWPISRTFRSGNQENLLIQDNRTRDFSSAAPDIRRYLSMLSWNDATLAEVASTNREMNAFVKYEAP